MINLSYRHFLILFSFLFIFNHSQASHLMGGEITWECQSNGRFVFEVKLYRDCTGIPGPTNLALTSNAPGNNNINCNLISQTDISPPCNGPSLDCATGTAGSTEQFIFRSNPILINGVPPATGWYFYYDDCCRNNVANLAGGSGSGFTLRAIMYPYNGQNTNPCYDSSPKFFERPSTLLCTGYPFTFNHNATDDELDSLVYEWDRPLDQPTGSGLNTAQPLAFSPGYSYTSPLPGPTQNPNNVAATFNSATGEISYTSFTSGIYVQVVKVSAYRCGQKIAEIFRDIQTTLNVCAPISVGVPNNPPAVSAPFVDPNTGIASLYIDTVYAGDLVTFTFNATDFDITPTFQFQNISLSASGLQFDQNFTNPNGNCLNPPCATLTPPPNLTLSQQSTSTVFSWQTDCSHLSTVTAGGCRNFGNVYNFIIKASDDFCSIPGVTVSTITIVVLQPELAMPPDLRCASVAANGDVSLSWVPGVDTANSFKKYYIYFSNNENGPYSLIDSIDDKTVTAYTHAGAGAHLQQGFYFMEVSSGCDSYLPPQQYSDTIKTIKLDVTNPGNGFAELNWNATRVPLIGTNHNEYEVYREYPLGTWSFIGTVPANDAGMSYNDPVTLCYDSLNYRVEVDDSSGCVSRSSIDGDVFEDRIAPAIIEIDSATVNPNGNAYLSWLASIDGDTKKYVIFRKVGNTYLPIDTVDGINTNAYLTGLDATVQSENFKVLAIDSCGNPGVQSLAHNTIYLQGQLRVCEGKIELFWNDYINWTSVPLYTLFVTENGGPVSQLYTGNDLSFSHENLNQFSNYCYYLVATDTGAPTLRTSSSNTICIVADIPKVPDFGYITTATVSGANNVMVKTYVDTSADILRYELYRSEQESGPYAKIAIQSPSADSVIVFEDNSAAVNDRSFYYKVIAIDSCGVKAFETEIAHTVYLSAKDQQDISNLLEWNSYEGWLGDVLNYRIFRSIDGGPYELVNFAAPSTEALNDNVSNKLYAKGVFCYYIQGVEGSGNDFGFSDSSKSNEVCVIQKPIVFIPNAISPNGVNKLWLPLQSFTQVDSYELNIFNRYGENIFSTRNVTQPWDGTYKGKALPEGMYIYFLKVKSTDGFNLEKQGSITIIY
ncbi:MAG: hypothetical protein RIQ89_1958 [Bacteroidota bacterium]|jgi:gliding motility-associated-like protein